MHLTTNRLYLRPVAVADAPALFAARGDPLVMKFWDWPAVESLSEVEEVVKAHAKEIEVGRALRWVVATSESGPAIGECDLSEIDPDHMRAEIGFMFARAYWGRGYALEAMRVVVGHALGPLGLKRLWARCHAGNLASIRLLERLEFALEGILRGHVLRDGVRRDCLLFGLAR